MVRRLFSLKTGAVGLVLIAVLVMGLAGPVSAFAAKRPVVSSLSPATGLTTGGYRVAITGKHFKVNGKSVVQKVTFGGKVATRIRVKSATLIKVTAPAGTDRVNVRVTTKAGTSARVHADRFTYVGPATQMALSAGDNQTASLGAAVKVAPSVIVKDAKGRPVPGVSVAFAVASGGGSVTGSPARTDATGIATVGSWKLGTTVGANTLTATSAGLTGSPVTFTATGDAGILLVELAGTPVRAYSLDELKALTPFAGYAGYRSKAPANYGPDAVTGVKVTDIVKDALGTPLATTQSVDVKDVYGIKPGSVTFRQDQLEHPATCCTMYTTAGVEMTSFTGTLAAVLVYSDPAGVVMPADKGPLRFFVADTASETLMTGSFSMTNVDTLNVTTP
jgi:hypothetical protein